MSEREKMIFKHIKRLDDLRDDYKSILGEKYYHFIKDPKNKNKDKNYDAFTKLNHLILLNILLLEEYFRLTEEFKKRSSEYNDNIELFSPIREIFKDFTTPRIDIHDKPATSPEGIGEYEDDFSDEDDSEKKDDDSEKKEDEDEYDDDFIPSGRYNYRKNLVKINIKRIVGHLNLVNSVNK